MNMKQLLFAAAVTLFFADARAQRHDLEAQQFRRDFVSVKKRNVNGLFTNGEKLSTVFNEEKYLRFRNMRNGGIALTFVGAGLITTGALLIASAEDERDYDYYADYNNDRKERKVIAGVFCILFGTVSTGGGITMWVIGNNKMKKYGGGQVSVQPAKNGLGVACHF
ncbi:hypothetical protein [Niabella aquatica]